MPGDGGAPPVVVVDEQHDVAIDLARWTRLAAAVLADEGVRPDAELSVLFVAEPAIADLNERFMGAPGPTDVLSFPIDGPHARRSPAPIPGNSIPGTPTAGTPVATGGEPAVLLGDVVVCPAVAQRNAPGHAGTLEDELALLLVHGILHLLGHDHAEAGERSAMQARERELLLAHHGAPARDPWSA